MDPGGHDNLVGLEHELDGAVVVVDTDVDSGEEDVLVAGEVLLVVVVIDTDVDPGEEDVHLAGEGVVLLDVETVAPGGKVS